MIGDGVLPSNEGRGYILRRILRRAVRHGRLLGIDSLFLSDAVDVAAKIFDRVYPELAEKKDYIKKVVEMEETRFRQTLHQGTEILRDEMEKLRIAGENVLAGADAFKLYDTFGFPWELTAEILQENGMTMDKAGFDAEMKAQRERARCARLDKDLLPIVYNTTGIDEEKLTVDEEAKESTIALLYEINNPQPVKTCNDGENVAIILDVAPFHAEGGGQMGDTGILTAPSGVVEIANTKKLPNGITILLGQVVEGFVTVGDKIKAGVNSNRKNDIARNHTATHLLHAALRMFWGLMSIRPEVMSDRIGCALTFRISPKYLKKNWKQLKILSMNEFLTQLTWTLWKPNLPRPRRWARRRCLEKNTVIRYALSVFQVLVWSFAEVFTLRTLLTSVCLKLYPKRAAAPESAG